ncbi:flagellar hook protein FlgE [Ruminiclostridium cellobioparum]|uniref:flagellar hook protein FlgE n=1 Tax=Ruminiclostridium cellobioparum TaxID=29355 RepID=UPI000489A88A|nr:flagellar hook protein FlgE [Ruminiclostridium cellobioparum]
MMRSMFSGVSGLRAHQTRMDVIGNNVANVNTVGFKSGRVTFQEVFNQTLRGAGAPDAALGRGGTNPMQIGLGTGVGAIDTMMTRGSSQRTDNPTDLSIEGEGFFIVKGSNADTFKFTRAGNFGLDKLGNLVSGSGMNVYGWMKYDRLPDGTIKYDTESEIGPINLYNDEFNGNKRVIAPKATTNAVFSGNLNSSIKTDPTMLDPQKPSEGQFSVPFTAYDSLGNSHEFSICYWNTSDGTTNTWNYKVFEKTIDPDTGEVGYDEVSGTTTPLTFDANGKFQPPTEPDELLITDLGNGAAELKITLDFSNVTMFSADCSVKPTNIDGYTTGNLVTFNIGSDGVLTGIYSNGQQQPLGMVALASFSNPAGLQKIGDNLFIPTTNSGDFTKGLQAGSEGVGSLSPGTLEMSNVDLSREFTDMIITQRGFQANSRIITTSDEMLQELVNLKR